MITDEETSSITSLVEESEETAEIARQLQEYLSQDRQSIDRMRALRTGLGMEVVEIPYKTDQ